MINTATEELGLHNDDQLADALSSEVYLGLMSLSVALGEIVGPPLGGFLVEEYSYQVTFALLTLICLVVLVVYAVSTYPKWSRVPAKPQEQQSAVEFKYEPIPSAAQT
jgi:predicted MFS family arabinose efflux permease